MIGNNLYDPRWRKDGEVEGFRQRQMTFRSVPAIPQPIESHVSRASRSLS